MWLLAAGLMSCDRAPETKTPRVPDPEAREAPPMAPADPEPAPEPEPEPEGVPGGGPDPRTLDGSASTSVGSPTEGHLTRSVPLPPARTRLRVQPPEGPDAPLRDLGGGASADGRGRFGA